MRASSEGVTTLLVCTQRCMLPGLTHLPWVKDTWASVKGTAAATWVMALGNVKWWRVRPVSCENWK
jgi:hypothetical protein